MASIGYLDLKTMPLPNDECSAIYVVGNLLTGGFYIGRSATALRRIGLHLAGRGSSVVSKEIRKHGAENFRGALIEIVLPPMLIEREAFWIRILSPPYNQIAWGDGVLRHSEETRAKMSAARIGKPGTRTGSRHSSETRRKLSMSHRGQEPWNKGKKTGPLSTEHRAKIGASHTGMKRSDEARAIMSCAQRGHVVTEKTRAKLSSAQTGKTSPRKGAHLSEETKQKISYSKRGAVITLEHRINLSIAALADWKRRKAGGVPSPR